MNHIGGVILSVLASSAVDGGFEPRNAKPKTNISIYCFSAKHVALRCIEQRLVGRNQKKCRREATCLPADCCFSELHCSSIIIRG